MNILLKSTLVIGAVFAFDANLPAKAPIISPAAPAVYQNNIHDAYWRRGGWGHGYGYRHGFGFHFRGPAAPYYHAPTVPYYAPTYYTKCWRDVNGYRQCRRVYN